MKKFFPALFVLTCLLQAPRLLEAQSDRGRISGVAYDSSGAIVGGVIVHVLNPLNEAVRQTVTDERGFYLVDSLLPASYNVAVSAPGFGDLTVSDVKLGVGEQRSLDLRLQPAGLKESVTVSAEFESQVQTHTASVAGTIGEEPVNNLPINGRMISNLYLLAPGAQLSGSGSFGDVRFFGRSNEQNVIRYDGIQAGTIIDSNPADMTGAAGASGFRLSQSLENIQEFHVESSTYSAEFGRGTGGQVTITTKSGSNLWHGNLFEYVRNDWFDARNYFDRGAKQAPLRLNQFGGSIGGAILKDKLFFFASQENLLQRVYVTFRQSTLSNLARSQAVTAIQPLLAAFPAGQISTVDPLQDIVTGTLSSYIDEYFGNMRLDYRFNDRHSVYVRYSRDQGEGLSPSDVSGSGTFTSTVPQNGLVDLQSVLTSRVINNFKFGVNAAKNRYIIQGVNVPGADIGNATITVGGANQSGSTGFVKPTGAGSSPLFHSNPFTNHEFEIIDNLSWTTGSHNVKTGVEINPRRMSMDSAGGIVYTFTNLQNFLQNVPSQIQYTGDLNASPSPFNSGFIGNRVGTQYFLGAYIQDEWRIRPNFTLSAGVRYDYFSPLKEAHNLLVNVDTLTGLRTPGNADPYRAPKLDFGPRLALTWSPRALGNRTVFRIGAGYYRGPGQSEDQNQPILNDVVNQTFSTGVAYPIDRPALLKAFNPNDPNGLWQPRVYANGYTIPEIILSYSASIQQSLPDGSTLTAAYVGSQGRNLFQRTISNLITGVTMSPTTGAAIIQRQFGDRYAEMDVKTSGGSSSYNALNLNWNRRLSRGLNASASYTWGHSIGTSSGSNEATTAENNFSFAQERGENSSDERHVFTMNAIWQIPTGANRRFQFGGNRFINTVLGDWQISGFYNYHSALPINVLVSRNNVVYLNPQTGAYYTNPVVSGGQVLTVPVINLPGGGQSRGTQRPDLVPGVNPYLDTVSGYVLNPAAFTVPAPGTFGNLGRNALRGLDFKQLDMALAKDFAITERTRFTLRWDVYNIFNHPNFSNPPSVLGGGLPSSPTAAGIQPGQPFTQVLAGTAFGGLNSTVGRLVNFGTARQMQLSARFAF
jgi:Carboxypeptidase regulatory-like domain/TonB dependent receptor